MAERQRQEQLRRRRNPKSLKPAWETKDSKTNTEDERNRLEMGTPSLQKYLSYKKRATKLPNSDILPRLLTTPVRNDPLDKYIWKLLCDSVLADMTPRLVRDAMRELCEEYLETEAILSVINDLTFEILLQQDGYPLVKEVLNEFHEERFLADQIFNPVILDLLHEVAAHTIEAEKEELFKRNSKEVAFVAQQDLLDSSLVEELLFLLAEQGRLWTETEEQNGILDGFIMDTLLGQLHRYQEAETFIHECIPLNKLHQQIVTDISLNVLLQQLSASLTEDERQVDNLEQEHKTIQSAQKTPVPD